MSAGCGFVAKRYRVSGRVEVFPVAKPWVYVGVPRRCTEETRHLAERGLVAVRARLGSSVWDTSLMPKGDGTHFIPLPARVRKAESVAVGDMVRLSFALRER